MQKVWPESGPNSCLGDSSVMSSSSASSATIFERVCKPSRSRFATVSPTPSMAMSLPIAALCLFGLPSSSLPASSSLFSTSSRSTSRLPISAAITEAISGPILGRPKAAMKVLSVMLRVASSSSITLLADLSAILSRPAMSL